MGGLMLEATYGTEIIKSIGEELVYWNREAMKLVSTSFFEFWLVDVFHFCKRIQ